MVVGRLRQLTKYTDSIDCSSLFFIYLCYF